MDIKTLMIGDWVYNKHHRKNIKLTQYDFFTHTHNKFGEQELAPFAKPTFGRDLEPIPLTPEILKKNGFEMEGGVSGCYLNNWWLSIFHWNENRLELVISDDTSKPYRLAMDIKYVHQLQHALRLCGINKNIEL